MLRLIRLPLVISLLFWSCATFAQSLPRFEAQTLSGKKAVFPDALQGRPAIFVVGFSRKSQAQTKVWGRHLAEESGLAEQPYYEVAILEDVPRFIRGVVANGIRKSVPEKQHDRFLLVYAAEKEWKQLVEYSAADDAYVVVVDKAGRLLWKTHGSFTEVDWAALKSKLPQH